MAITEIHKITLSPNRAISYGLSDKHGEAKDDIHKSIAYAVNDKTGEVTYFTLSSFLNCSQVSAIERFHFFMNEGRGKFRKEKPRTKNGEEVVAWQLTQSFEGHEVPPDIANEIGFKLASEIFGNYACTVSTHTNTDNIHNHIVVCAWDMDGRKWNDNHASKRLIRSVSDRLCEEYGLGVLYNTQDMKLISYKDKNGVQRFYEPTDRKNALLKKRELGELSTGDANDYRNTPSFHDTISKEDTNRREIKSDIDALLPSVQSYDELLERLRDLGYTINDKKKNGDWLRHVSFTVPLQGKATRDYKIGDGEFYTRENLTAFIESRAVDRNTVISQDSVPDAVKPTEIPYFENYEYGQTDISQINEEYRAAYSKGGGLVTVERSASERVAIQDIKRCDVEVKGLIDTRGIQKIIAERKNASQGRFAYVPRKREEQLIERICDGLGNLFFMERQGIHSYAQINDLYKAVYGLYVRNIDQLSKVEQLVSHFNGIIDIPQKVSDLEKKITMNKNNDEYIFEDYDRDRAILARYKKTLAQYSIHDAAGVQSLRAKVDDAQVKMEDIKKSLARYSAEIANYERCVRVLERIDRENGRADDVALREFNAIKATGANLTAVMEEKRGGSAKNRRSER